MVGVIVYITIVVAGMATIIVIQAARRCWLRRFEAEFGFRPTARPELLGVQESVVSSRLLDLAHQCHQTLVWYCQVKRGAEEDLRPDGPEFGAALKHMALQLRWAEESHSATKAEFRTARALARRFGFPVLQDAKAYLQEEECILKEALR